MPSGRSAMGSFAFGTLRQYDTMQEMSAIKKMIMDETESSFVTIDGGQSDIYGIQHPGNLNGIGNIGINLKQ